MTAEGGGRLRREGFGGSERVGQTATESLFDATPLEDGATV